MTGMMNKKQYYCVASSNKTGRMVVHILPCYSKRNPENKYIERLELYLDYFADQTKAEEFADLLRRSH